MKRSEINAALSEAVGFLRSMGFRLPPFAFWSPEEWAAKGPDCDEIRDNRLGWDVTDFGLGEFRRSGLVLFTTRSGSQHDPRYPKPYAEKVMVVEEDQVTPFHFHWNKMEDIINRGGGNLLVTVHEADEDEGLSEAPVRVNLDGRTSVVPAGTVLRLRPGESITFPTRQYHEFRAEPGCGKVLLGEVSQANDDAGDNRFLLPIGRYPTLEEDAPPFLLLCNEYPAARGGRP